MGTIIMDDVFWTSEFLSISVSDTQRTVRGTAAAEVKEGGDPGVPSSHVSAGWIHGRARARRVQAGATDRPSVGPACHASARSLHAFAYWEARPR